MTASTTTTTAAPAGLQAHALPLLQGSARLWFCITVLSQWFFALYVMMFHGGMAMRGQSAPQLHAGDPVGNATWILHIVMAFIMLVGGPLQFIPQLRQRLPRFHRINGRVYLLCGCLLSLGGVYLILSRGTAGTALMHLGLSLNGLAVLVCAWFAYARARARDIAAHQRWAWRFFAAAGGVWMFRVAFMLWMMVVQPTIGPGEDIFKHPVTTFITYAQFIVPLAVMELYFRVRARGSASARLLMAGAVGILSLVIAAGSVAATIGMWLPDT